MTEVLHENLAPKADTATRELGDQMASTFENVTGFATYFPTTVGVARSDFRQVYEDNRHRIYALSFWMTDNELVAEELMKRTFVRAFALDEAPSAEDVDSALIAELREIAPIGELTLNCATCTQVAGVRLNTLRVHLERAIVEIPSTERVLFLLHDVEGYRYDRISRLLGLSVRLCQSGVHQARLRIRELLASMVR